MKSIFSVIIPTLNEEKYLPNLLNDLVKQTFQDFEVIVVDGNSSDKTVSKARGVQDKFQKLTILTTKKRNVSYQRNLGAKKVEADWLIFMDADNRLPPFFLQGIKYKIESLKPDILSTWIEPDSNNKKDKATANLANIFIDIQKSTTKPYLLESMLGIRKKTFEKLSGFDETLHWGEGIDLLRRASRKGIKFSFLRDPKYTYSFRRLRKLGTLKTIRGASQIELRRLMNRQIPKDKAKRLYPMQGGKYFEVNKTPSSRLEKIVSKMLSNPTFNNKRKPNLLKRIISFKKN